MFERLALQLRHTDAGEAVIRASCEGTADLEPMPGPAAARLSSTAEWFPTTSQWRDRVGSDSPRTDRRPTRAPAQGASARLSVCDDTGWQPVDVVQNELSVRRVTPVQLPGRSAAANSWSMCRCRRSRRHLPSPNREAREKARMLVKTWWNARQAEKPASPRWLRTNERDPFHARRPGPRR